MSFVRYENKYFVAKWDDIVKALSLKEMGEFERFIKTINEVRNSSGKKDRKYLVISDKDKELYENSWTALEKSLSNHKPQPEVTYELVTDMTKNEIAKAMIDGDSFYSHDGVTKYSWDGEKFIAGGNLCHVHGKYYRRVEPSVDWRDAVIEELGETYSWKYGDFDDTLEIDTILDKKDAISLANTILKATEG